jgi:uncharacterized protein
MSIVILEQSAQLDVQGESRVVGKPLSEPACVTRTLPVEIDGLFNSRTGIWDVSVGSFRRELANAEVMHILAGECTFTPEGGEPREIRAGDTLFFPANTHGVWNIRTPLRKLYVVLG